jgi:putative inorganic carbon (hco3(-)) transporter
LEESTRPNGKGAELVSALAGRSGRYLLLYGGALLLAVVVGAVLAYSERFGGDNAPYILLGALLAIAVAVAILLQWRLGAFLLAAALPFQTLINVGPVASGMKALALLTFVSFALALLMDRKLFERFARLWQQPLALAVLAFVLWVSGSILWASDKGAALVAAITYLGVFGLMVVIGLLERRYLILAWSGLMFSAAFSVPAGYILPLPEGSDMATSGRFGPGGADPNGYACLVAIAFVVAYFGLLRRHRMIAYLLAPVFVYGIFATGSRTGLIALVVPPLLALFVPQLAARLGSRILPMYVLGAAAITVIVLAIPSVGERALERYMTIPQYQSEETWSGRWSIWQGALEVIASHPILGVGVGNFAEFAIDHSTLIAAHSLRDGEIVGVAHNMFLGVASELGLVGLILFLGILFFAFKTAVPIARGWDLGTGIFLGLIASMIAGMALSWENYLIVYVLFGSVLALELHNSARRAPSLDKHEGPH